jgi:Fe-S cluster assembly iron-binding protein IscA
MHPSDKLKALIERDKAKISLSDEATKFLKSFRTEVDDALEVGEDDVEMEQLVFRIGLINMMFWIGFEDEHAITDLDVTLHEDKELKVIAQDSVFEFLRGCVIDYELHGLSKSLVFKDKAFDRPYCIGETHPAASTF